jgi:hypothetical protein
MIAHKQPVTTPSMLVNNKGPSTPHYQGAYVPSRPTIKAQDPTYNDVPPLLQQILEIKRPTKNPELCALVIEQLLRERNLEYTVDKARNYTVEVDVAHGNNIFTPSRVCFTSHTDTVHSDAGFNDLVAKDGLLRVDGGGVLGADCGTGIYIMLEMIDAGVPGVYVFFAEEEKGRIGSRAYRMPADIEICVSFDRKDVDNLITHQSGEQGCSEEFAKAFIERFDLPYKADPTGMYTDSYTFFGEIPECVNLSVGYYSQHTKDECQDLGFLSKLVHACCIMDWESLPSVVREPVGYIYQGVPYTDLCEFVFDHPDVAAEVLEAYGVTLDDMVGGFTNTTKLTTKVTTSKAKPEVKKSNPSTTPKYWGFADDDLDDDPYGAINYGLYGR